MNVVFLYALLTMYIYDADTPFKQQRLKAWQPILTPNWVIGTFALVGLIFIPIGVILHIESDNVVEMAMQYDGNGADQYPFQNDDSGTFIQNLPDTTGCYLENDSLANSFDLTAHGCVLHYKLKEDMKAPIMVYYQLENFYQNHRRYVSSRSDPQLRGDPSASLSTCDSMKSSTMVKYDSVNATPANATAKEYNLNPCGLIANSLFNGNSSLFNHSLLI